MSNTEKDMDSGRRGLLAGILAFSTSTPLLVLASQDWVDVKDPNELRALHSNKTFRGVGGDGVSWVAYYRSDGKALVVRTDYRFTRTWEVRENGVLPGHPMARLPRVPTQQGKPQRVSTDLG
jgi:hypothetical protein